jgi:hypothetical protein
MRLFAVLIALSALSTPALAQQSQTYQPLDRDLWEAMSRAFAELPASLSTHTAIQQIMQNAQREAHMREAQRIAQEKSKAGLPVRPPEK